MSITYRTTGAWGPGKGSNLTAAEVDGNFHDLDQRVTGLESNPPTPDEISNITVTGTQMTIWLVSGAHFGPFTLPQAAWRPAIVATVASGTYTLVLTDQNRYLRCTDAGGCAITIPANGDVAFPVNTEIIIRQAAAGQVTVAGDGGVTVNVPDGFAAQTGWQGATVRIKKVAADEWDIWGDLDLAT